MRLIKLDEFTYLNPTHIIKLEVNRQSGSNCYEVEVLLTGEKKHPKYFQDLESANDYLQLLIEKINQDDNKISVISDRVCQLEQAILFQPGGSEYEKAEKHFDELVKNEIKTHD